MKPLDDFLPEETHHPELIILLQHTSCQPAPITVSEREETIARARERLCSQISGSTVHDQEAPIQLVGPIASSVLPDLDPVKTPRRVRIMRVLNATAAILIVGAIVGASLVLFSRHGAPSQVTPSDNRPASTGSGSQQGLTLKLTSDRFEIRTPGQMCTFLLVADVNVTGVGKAHWNTLTGTKPADASELTVMQKGYYIYTPMKLILQHIYIDHRHQPTQEFVSIGGQVGADRIVMEDFPRVTSGRYLMVFTPTLMFGQKGFDATRLTLYSAFPISSQDIVMLQPKMIEQGQVSQQEVDMPLAQVAQQLASCK